MRRRGIDYFENSRRATYVRAAICHAQPPSSSPAMTNAAGESLRAMGLALA